MVHGAGGRRCGFSAWDEHDERACWEGNWRGKLSAEIMYEMMEYESAMGHGTMPSIHSRRHHVGTDDGRNTRGSITAGTGENNGMSEKNTSTRTVGRHGIVQRIW